MTFEIDIQHASTDIIPISDDTLRHWVSMTLASFCDNGELTLRLVDEKEIQTLNHTYRHMDKPTNVLAFPFVMPDITDLDIPLLGDVIICPAIVSFESISDGKLLEAHWAHIVIHGVLHLLGYDHIKEDDTAKMQKIEIDLLSQLNFSNPYLVDGEYVE